VKVLHVRYHGLETPVPLGCLMEAARHEIPASLVEEIGRYIARMQRALD